MKSQLFRFSNQLLSQITVLRKISSTDRFPCFSCFDDKIDKLTCKVCVGSGFIYGSHPMVQFSEDFIEKKIEYLKKQQEARKIQIMDFSNSIDKNNSSLSKSIEYESKNFNEKQTNKGVRTRLQNVSIQIETNQSNQLRSNDQEHKELKMSDIIQSEDKRDQTIVHHGYCCDSCDQDPIIGYRYHCETCEDYDLCSKCYKITQHNHNFTIFKQTKGALKASFNPTHDNLLKSIRNSCRKID